MMRDFKSRAEIVPGNTSSYEDVKGTTPASRWSKRQVDAGCRGGPRMGSFWAV